MHLVKSIHYLSACFQASHEKKRLEESITQVVLSSMLLIIKHYNPCMLENVIVG